MTANPPTPPPPPDPNDPHGRPTSGGHGGDGGHAPTSGAAGGEGGHSEISAADMAAMSAHASRGAPIEQPGVRIGAYRLLTMLGEGGFGVVWLAEQSEPVRRRVALKIIKPGMDSKDILARFDQERQALALMDHPAIAKVFDGGVTPPEMGSRPYFVMELVHGDPITNFCDRERMDLRRRLDLFIRVCDAVQHAHQKGIIHRDIKPTNILVEFQDGQPAPKVIDFGVAKALHRPLTDKTLFTETGRLIGTPEYMSPEQAEMSAVDIDTRSDVYSLGVLLYELLTGTLPFDARTLRAAGLVEIQRIIRDVTPPKPSTRLSTIAGSGGADLAETIQRPTNPPSLKQSMGVGGGAFSVDAIAKARQTDPRTLSRHLRRDLDWVVMKCLEKERNRRYATANALGADLRRFLDDEPVSAGPPSVTYKAAKFIRRHRLPVVAAGLVALALVAATVVSVVSARAAWRARVEAEQSEKEATEVSFFLYEVIAKIKPGPLGLDMLEALRADLSKGLAARGTPADDAKGALAAFETALRDVNKSDAARSVIEKSILARAVEAAEGKFKDQPVVQARLMQTLANAYANLGLYEKARQFNSQAVETRRRVLGARAKPTLTSIAALSQLEYHNQNIDGAVKLATEALEGRRATLGEAHSETIASITILGTLVTNQGKHDDGEKLFAEALAAGRKHLGNDDKVTIEAMTYLAGAMIGRGELDGAGKLVDEAVERATRALGSEDGNTLAALEARAEYLKARKKPDEALAVLRQINDTSRRVFGRSDPAALRSAAALARQLLDVGKAAEAEPIARELVDLREAMRGPEHAQTLEMRVLHGRILTAMNKHDEAAAALGAVVESAMKISGKPAGAAVLVDARLALACALTKGGKFGECERLLTGMAAQAELDTEDKAAVYGLMVDLYEAWDAAEAGKGYGEKAKEWRERSGEKAK